MLALAPVRCQAPSNFRDGAPAEELGLSKAAKLLQTTLKEEESTDKALTAIAE